MFGTVFESKGDRVFETEHCITIQKAGKDMVMMCMKLMKGNV